MPKDKKSKKKGKPEKNFDEGIPHNANKESLGENTKR